MTTTTATARPGHRRQPLTAPQWYVLVVLAAVAASLLTALAMSTPEAVAQTRSATPRMVVVTGQLTPSTFGVFVVDTERETLVVYEVVPQGRDSRVLQLRAARTLVFDTQLEAYNTAPDPAEVAEMVRQARRIGQ